MTTSAKTALLALPKPEFKPGDFVCFQMLPGRRPSKDEAALRDYGGKHCIIQTEGITVNADNTLYVHTASFPTSSIRFLFANSSLVYSDELTPIPAVATVFDDVDVERVSF
jgi:hypothetical protein